MCLNLKSKFELGTALKNTTIAESNLRFCDVGVMLLLCTELRGYMTKTSVI